MFDYVQIGIISILLSAIIIIFCGIIYYGYVRRHRDRDNRTLCKALEYVYGSCIIVIMIAFIITAIWGLSWWDDAVSLPFEYQAAEKTVKEIKELLTDENATIGEGLEAIELKQSIKDAIEKKNDLRADIYAWLYNPFMPFKDVLLERLPPDFFD